MIVYEHFILLHKLYNTQLPEVEWTALNFQQLVTSRQTKFSIIKNNNRKVGNNILAKLLNIVGFSVKLEMRIYVIASEK